jgi:hypothetical protein
MDRNNASRLWIGLLCAAVLVFAGVAGASDEQKKDDDAAAEKNGERAEGKDAARGEGESDEVLVFTNEDLERLFADTEAEAKSRPLDLPPAKNGAEQAEPAGGQAAPEPPVKQVEPSGAAGNEQFADPLQWMADRKAQRADWERRVAEAEQEVATLQERVTELEKRILATRNPLLARPKIPEEEKEEWDSGTAPERVEKSQEQLDQAKAELAEAQRELTRLRNSRP